DCRPIGLLVRSEQPAADQRGDLGVLQFQDVTAHPLVSGKCDMQLVVLNVITERSPCKTKFGEGSHATHRWTRFDGHAWPRGDARKAIVGGGTVTGAPNDVPTEIRIRS